MSKNNNDNEVIVGMRKGKQRQPGLTGIDFWEGPFTNSEDYNSMKDFLKFPTDIMGKLASGVYRDEAEIAAIVDAYSYCDLFSLDDKAKEIDRRIGASNGWLGFSRAGQIQLGVGVGLPGVLRDQLQMKKVKRGEDAVTRQSSDFRSEGTTKEVDQK